MFSQYKLFFFISEEVIIVRAGLTMFHFLIELFHHCSQDYRATSHDAAGVMTSLSLHRA